MIEFKPIELEDKEIFEKYFQINKDANSECNFTVLYAWREYFKSSYAIVSDCLCVKNAGSYMYPVGAPENVSKALIELSANAACGGAAYLKISPITPRMAQNLPSFKLAPIRYQFDYVYKREKLAAMSGKKLHKKRNHLNYFENNYKFEMIDLTEDKMQETREFLESVIFERSLSPKDELFATLEVVNERNRLDLVSKLLYAGGRLAGLIIAQNHHGTALIHIAKADVEIRGASVALFSYFLRDNLTECEYVNFMEDMGIEGLRQMKESYYPEFLIEKFSATRPLVKTARILEPAFEPSVKNI